MFQMVLYWQLWGKFRRYCGRWLDGIVVEGIKVEVIVVDESGLLGAEMLLCGRCKK